jgi:hypothetical protein
MTDVLPDMLALKRAGITANGSVTPVGTPTLLDRMRARVVKGLALSELPRPEWLVEGLLPTQSVTMSYGPPKSGKSFAAIDLAACVATGRPWMGQATKQAPVLYVAGEGQSGIIIRQEAWSIYHGATVELDAIHWYPAAVNLFSPEHGSALAALAGEIGAGLVIIDTLARCAVGAEESSAKDMGIIVSVLDQIRDACGGCVHVLHHSGKDKDKGARGSTALVGAVDIALQVSGGTGRVRIELVEAKDVATGFTATFGMEQVGESIVLVPGAGNDGRALFAKAAEALSALSEGVTVDGLASTAWMDLAEMTPSTFYRARKYLVDKGMVTNIGTSKQPRYVVGVGSP